MAKRTLAPWRTWGVRALVVVVIAAGVGAAVGVQAVNTLDPGAPGQADSLALWLDSVSNDSASRPAAPASKAKEPEAAPVVVPNVVGMAEGDARGAIERAGFTVGTILFQTDPAPAGTVLSTFPVTGEAVVLPATVNLVISNGPGGTDTAPPPIAPDSVSAS